jgi:hypothetical protein
MMPKELHLYISYEILNELSKKATPEKIKLYKHAILLRKQ